MMAWRIGATTFKIDLSEKDETSFQMMGRIRDPAKHFQKIVVNYSKLP
jgi:hypothetical protein